MNGQNRTDRILIAVALIILMLATGLFYFDGWMWGARRGRGERIGEIVSRKGDVRMKYDDDLKWQKASTGTDLEYNDAVYAGAGSQAELMVGESKMTVTENTLVVLRRDQNVNFLNLNYGTLFGKIAKNEKVIIDTGDGKPIELNTANNAQIVLRRNNGKTQLDVTSGEASITVNGKTSKVTKSSRVVVGDKTPAELKPNHLKAVKPLRDQVITSDDPATIEFAWGWDNGRAAQPAEQFTLEFSGRPDFSHIHITKKVQGQLTTSMTVAQSVSLYYRIKAANNEVSPVERVNFVRLDKPLIILPQANSHIEATEFKTANVTFEFRGPKDATVWYQIASDQDFKQVVLNQNTPDMRTLQSMNVGQYFLRARSDFGNGRSSGWTAPQTFAVDPRLETLPLAKTHLPTRVIIPNASYPRLLYLAPSDMIQSYLATHGLLRDFFPLKPDEFDELKVQMENGDKEAFNQKDTSWPQRKLRPGRFAFRYQASKTGFLPSAWSDPKKLEIVMEPPKPLGEAKYGDANSTTGYRTAEWAFTPLLFAKSYDLEVSQNLNFADALEFKAEKAVAQTELPPGDYYWRARARDGQGRIISEFSKPYKLAPMPQPQLAPPLLTKNNDVKRGPAQEAISTRVERVREQAWERSGWWAWLGSGENYVDYRQSLPGTGTLTSHGVKGGSQYFEGGFLGGSGIGGVISYKNTPGQFQIEGVPVNPNSYRWTTLALEAMAKKPSPFMLFDSPIYWGLRAGIQQHQMPFLSLSSDGTAVDLKNNQMTAGSLGLLAEWARNRWTYYWSMRYQVPLSSKADGAASFSTTPVFAFDGGLGTSYNFTQRLKAGFFWYGQWHQMNFQYADGDVTNAGFQSLFFSSMDLRLGFDF